MKDKFILDACCGPRMMWFDKSHPKTLYIDNRVELPGFVANRKYRQVKPDIIMDFRRLDFEDKSFKLIAWDPPHLIKLGKTSVMAKTFGRLDPWTWDSDIRQGFLELWRVLDDYGVLVFKWCVRDIPIRKVLRLFPERPLFGHTTGSNSQTRWMTFMKIPKQDTLTPTTRG